MHLPELPVELFLRAVSKPKPLAVTENNRIHACDLKARSGGVKQGMQENAALALLPGLVLKSRDPSAETKVMLGLAAWASQFTPATALSLPDTLVLDVTASLKLFGTPEVIVSKLSLGLRELGFCSAWAVAPTASAACWFARMGQQSIVVDHQTLMRKIAALPLAVLEHSARLRDDFSSLGLTTIGDIQSLPRDGVTRRFGKQLLAEIDRGTGQRPDPRAFFKPPAMFLAEIELPAEATQADALFFASRRLLIQLAGFLVARSSGIERFSLKLLHRTTITEIHVGMISPSQDAEHFSRLLRERLGTRTLKEPVRAIAVVAESLRPICKDSGALFMDDPISTGSWKILVDQLRSRLGEKSVHGLSARSEHRPEHAGIPTEPGAAQLQLALEGRPFWMLDTPCPIDPVDHYSGGAHRVQLISGPERIESGWWDGRDVSRDYFVALSPENSLLWVYRERPVTRLGQEGGWYLHGIFS